MVKFLGALLVLIAFSALTLAQYENKTEEEFVEASKECSASLPKDLISKLERFEYPDTPEVKVYLQCVWKKLQLWDDTTGFNVEHIAELYKDKERVEVLIPILSECNRNALKNIYESYMCILKSRVGGWFMDDVNAFVNSKQKN